MASASVFRKRTGDINIAVSSDADTENRLEEYVVPAATWAIFSGAGTGISIQELERRIATEWLPTSGYEFADAPDIELYFEPDPQDTHYEGRGAGEKGVVQPFAQHFQ